MNTARQIHVQAAALLLPAAYSDPAALLYFTALTADTATLSSSFITVFVTVFATVIALTKDLPDVVGDRQHGIQTFATILGAQRLTALGDHLIPFFQRTPWIGKCCCMIADHVLPGGS